MDINEQLSQALVTGLVHTPSITVSRELCRKVLARLKSNETVIATLTENRFDRFFAAALQGLCANPAVKDNQAQDIVNAAEGFAAMSLLKDAPRRSRGE